MPIVDETNIIAHVYADLARGTVQPVQVECTQYDAEMRVIAIHLRENNRDWDIPSGYAVNVRMKKQDGTSVYNPQQGEGNIAYITLSAQMCGVAGTQYFVVEIVKGDDVVQTVPIRLNVRKNPIEDKDFTSEDEKETIQQAIQNAVDAAEAAQSSKDAAAQSASQAASSASAAQTSAGSTAASAGAAQSASSSAYTLRNQAQTYANAAANSATAAQTAQTAAEAAAQQAQEAAEGLQDTYTKNEADTRFAPISSAIRPTVTGNPIHVEDSAEASVQELCVYGRTEQVTTTGAQLLDVDTCVIGGLSGSGAEYTAKDRIRSGYLSVEPDASYTLSGAGDGYSIWIYEFDADQTFIQRSLLTQFTTTETTKYLRVLFTSQPVADITEEQFAAFKELPIMLNTGSTALPWEPYTGGKPSPSPDYPQELDSVHDMSVTISDGGDRSQTLSVSGALPGIPVDSGGNYTDPDGQQWVCDTIDVVAKQKTQRIGIIDGYNGESVGDVWMSTTGQLTTGAKVLYQLDEPVTSQISVEVPTTYDGTTNVTATDGAGLSMRYIADTQKYIDNKIAAISAAMLEG